MHLVSQIFAPSMTCCKYASHYLRSEVRKEFIKYLERHNLPLARFMGDVIPLTMDLHSPLQAADVICWHLNRFYANALDDESLANMHKLNEKGIVGQEFDADMLADMEAMLIKQLRDGTL